jgi:hypothetical protein
MDCWICGGTKTRRNGQEWDLTTADGRRSDSCSAWFLSRRLNHGEFNPGRHAPGVTLCPGLLYFTLRGFQFAAVPTIFRLFRNLCTANRPNHAISRGFFVQTGSNCVNEISASGSQTVLLLDSITLFGWPLTGPAICLSAIWLATQSLKSRLRGFRLSLHRGCRTLKDWRFSACRGWLRLRRLAHFDWLFRCRLRICRLLFRLRLI